MAIFIVAVGSAAARGLSIDCGCFGGGGQVAPGQTAYGAEIVRDTGAAAGAVWLVWRPSSRFALDHYREDGDAGEPARPRRIRTVSVGTSRRAVDAGSDGSSWSRVAAMVVLVVGGGIGLPGLAYVPGTVGRAAPRPPSASRR